MNDPLGLFEDEKGSDPLGLFADDEGIVDKGLGVGESALSMLTGGIAQPIAGLAGIMKGGSADAVREVQEALTYEPRTGAGKRYNENVGKVFQAPIDWAGDLGDKIGGNAGESIARGATEVALNFLPLGAAVKGAKGMLRPKEAARPPVDVSALKPDVPKPASDPLGLWEQQELPLETSAQGIAERRGAEVGQRDLFGPINEELGRPDMGQPIQPQVDARRAIDNAAHEAELKKWREAQQMEIDPTPEGYHADQYGGGQDGLRIDENGMPIRADRSMEAANLENPLQRNLWGDELPRQSAQEAPRGITAAIDRMPPGEARQAGIDMLSNGRRRAESGALNMDVFDPAFQKVKEIADGIRLVMKGRKEGPVVIALDSSGKKVGEVAFSHDTWARPPKPTDNLEAGWVTTDTKKMSGGLDVDRMAPTTPSKHKGIATEMYKFAAEMGNDIIPSSAQTPEGRAMWEKFEKRGVSQGMKIPRSQRGAVDYSIMVPKPLRDLVNRWIESGGSSYIGQIRRMVQDNPTKITEMQRQLLRTQFPETVKAYEQRINKAYDQGDYAKVDRYRKRLDEELLTDALGQGVDWMNKFNPDAQDYVGSNKSAQAREATRIALSSAQRRNQGGAIDLKAIEEGIKKMAGQTSSGTSKNLPLVARTPVANSMETPTLPATILKKNELRTKVEASALLKQLAPEYASVTTPQEAILLAKDAKDINKNPVRDATISGINGLTMLKRDNPVLNFARYALQEYRNTATKFSKDYITAKDTGVASTYAKLKGQDRVEAVEALREAAVAQIEITPENIKKLGLKPEQEAYILSVRKMLDAQWSMAADSLQMAGRNAFEKRAGYLPNLFTGSYKSLIGEMKGGVFVTKEIVQADTRFGHNKGVEAAKKANPNAVVRELPRVGLKQLGRSSNLFNGFNDIMNVIAKHDPRFAELQMAAQMKINEANHGLMNFDVHEMHKKGIKGSVGDNPMLTRQQNADQLGKAIIDFGEQGADYYASQKALNDIGEVLTSENVAHMPNTVATVADHVKHVTGQDLNPIGNALNWSIDGLFKAIGVSPKVPLAAARGLKTTMGIHMMGLWNPTFTALQLTQVLTGAMPEMLKVGAKLGQDVSKSAVSAPTTLAMLKYGKQMGVDVPVAEHMKAAFQYAQDHGIMDFSELEIAHKATRNKTINQAEKIGALPISIGEGMTRPPVFMAFADVFHKFGLPDNEAFMAAQHATNMAMGDYHPHERPKIYAGLGLVGEFGGALTTYKHNAITGMSLRAKDAVFKDGNGKRMITPALAAIATASLFQGISGMPGFDEADAAYQWATGLMGNRQGITETALQQVPDWGKYGYLSASTGLDFHSRTSMSRLLPEMGGAALSPQLAALADIGLKAYTYGKFKDEQSYQDFVRSITPSGLKGAVEDSMMTDKEGYVENPAGELMNSQPRTDKERLIRKLFAVKPLRESIEQKDVYIDAKSIKEKEDAQKVLSQRFRQAFARGDQEGMNSLAQMYYDKEGDMQTLMSDQALQNQIVRSGQSQRERMTGQLQATMKSINRYRDMNDGK